MAQVLNVVLQVGRGSGDREFATIEYDIEFREAEIAQNLWFDEFVALLDIDDERDRYLNLLGAEYLHAHFAVGNIDDDIGVIHFAKNSVRPDGQALVHRSFKRDWDFPDNESGDEEYRALIVVTPEVHAASAWSNEVHINLA